jgi:hypothetical protein
MKSIFTTGLGAALLLVGCGQAPLTAHIQTKAAEPVKAERSLKPMSVYVKEQVLKHFGMRVAIPEYRTAITDLEVSETPLGHTWTFTCVETVTDFMSGGIKYVNHISGTYSVADNKVRITKTTPIKR